jgi:hypothetical protein
VENDSNEDQPEHKLQSTKVLLKRRDLTQNCGAKPGERGPAGATIRSWKIEPAAYLATPIMGDGAEGPPLELRSLFEQFYDVASEPFTVFRSRC